MCNRWMAALTALLLITAPDWVLAQRDASISPAGGNEQRVALVIGNAGYMSSPLRNPVNDARAMAQALERLGFKVIKRENLRAKEIGPALREFRSRLSPGAVALFFYAGHGLQVKGVNYLPTVDAEIDAEEDVPTQSLNINNVLDLMEEAKTRVNLVFLDACRNNPFTRRFRSTAGGLAKVDTASGTLISFATRPGSVAADGDGANGLYTENLLRHMNEPGMPIEQLLKRVGSAVKLASKGRQEPWSEGLIEGDFYFRLPAGGAQMASARPSAAAMPAPAADPATVELAFWGSVKDSKSAEEYKAYLDQYPDGRFAALARTRLTSLTSSMPPVQIASAAPSSATTASETQQKPNAPLLVSGNLRAQSTYAAKDLRHAAFLEVLSAISTASAGGVTFEPLPAGAVVPAYAAVDAVSKRTLAAAWISPTFIYGKDSAFGLVEGAPFGLEPDNYAAWRNSKNVSEIVERLYRRYGVVGLACGVTAPHGDIWAKKPIVKVDDFKGLKLRAVGINISMFAKVGAAVNALPSSEIVPAMDRGLLDAAIILDPRSDLTLGLPDVSRVYMVGQLNGARGLDLVINADIWDGLRPDARNAIARACRSNLGKMVAESTRIASEAIGEMKKTVKIYKLPESVLSALRGAWNEVLSEEMVKNPTFRELAATMTAYDNAARRPNLSAYGLNKP